MKKIIKVVLICLVPLTLSAGINNGRAWLKGVNSGEYIRNSEGSKALSNATSLCSRYWNFVQAEYSGHKNDFMRGCLHGIKK